MVRKKGGRGVSSTMQSLVDQKLKWKINTNIRRKVIFRSCKLCKTTYILTHNLPLLLLQGAPKGPLLGLQIAMPRRHAPLYVAQFGLDSITYIFIIFKVFSLYFSFYQTTRSCSYMSVNVNFPLTATRGSKLRTVTEQT